MLLLTARERLIPLWTVVIGELVIDGEMDGDSLSNADGVGLEDESEEIDDTDGYSLTDAEGFGLDDES